MASDLASRRGKAVTALPPGALGSELRAPVQYAPPPDLAKLDLWKALDAFKMADFDKDGRLQMGEFKVLLKQFAHDKKFVDAPRLFEAIDMDRSGDISREEFIAWVFNVPQSQQPCPSSPMSLSAASPPMSPTTPGQRLGRAATMRDMSRPESPKTPASPTSPSSPKKLGHSLSSASLGAVGKQMLGEAPAMRPVVLQFQMGPSFDSAPDFLMSKIEQRLRYVGKEQVVITKKKDELLQGCGSVTVMAGSGIPMWHKASMMLYMEDPFKNSNQTKIWLNDFVKIHLPFLLKVINR